MKLHGRNLYQSLLLSLMLLAGGLPAAWSSAMCSLLPPKEIFLGVRSGRTVTQRMPATDDNSYSSTRYIFCLSPLPPEYPG